MNRWLSVVVSMALIGAVSGCNNPTCGPGTVQVQGKNNTLSCKPVDVQAAGIPCDVDGGAQIVGGKCISAITCGKNTMLSGGVCVSTGGGGGDEPPACPTPDSGKACVNGLIRDFVTNLVFKSEKIHVALYDPIGFIGGDPPLAEQDVAAGVGGYVFPNFTPPSLNLIAVVAGDPDFTTQSQNKGLNFVAAASGAQNVASGTYRVDIYALKRSTVDGWAGSPGGAGWYATGGYVSKFYSDLQPDQTDLEAIETHPVSGVTVTEPSGTNNKPASGTVYFSTDLSTTDTSLTTTSAVASGITPPPPNNVANFSGSGGVDGSGKAITWETQQGGSAAHIIFISRYHPTN